MVSWSKLPKKKSWKNGHFGLKTWVNPLGKMSIFRLSELLVFYSVERLFFVLEYHKRHFPGVNIFKKNWKNGHFWTKTMG